MVIMKEQKYKVHKASKKAAKVFFRSARMDPIQQQSITGWSSIWSEGVRWFPKSALVAHGIDADGRILIDVLLVERLCDKDRRWYWWLLFERVDVRGERSRNTVEAVGVWVEFVDDEQELCCCCEWLMSRVEYDDELVIGWAEPALAVIGVGRDVVVDRIVAEGRNGRRGTDAGGNEGAK